MKVVRAIRQDDIDGLLRLSKQTGGGMTTLKPDERMLRERIAVACASFSEKILPEQRDYLFVLEDTDLDEMLGVCAIKTRVGLDEPFYNYRLGTQVHLSKELNVYTRMDTLYLSNDLTGSSELCSLILHPDYRLGENGKLLSKSRFLFIAQFPHLFSEKIIAELRGFQHPDGSSPFWDSLGRHFFKMDFDQADDLCRAGKKSFIAELMPQYPMYTVHLSKEAQEAIGQVHVDTKPARHLLEQEGLHYEGMIDIFDAGPVLQARLGELRSVRTSQLVTVANREPNKESNSNSAVKVKASLLVANTNMQDYRVIVIDAVPENGQLPLTLEQQQALNCAPGSEVRVIALKNEHE